MKIHPMSGKALKHFSSMTLPIKPVHPVRSIFFPLKNSLIFNSGSFYIIVNLISNF